MWNISIWNCIQGIYKTERPSEARIQTSCVFKMRTFVFYWHPGTHSGSKSRMHFLRSEWTTGFQNDNQESWQPVRAAGWGTESNKTCMSQSDEFRNFAHFHLFSISATAKHTFFYFRLLLPAAPAIPLGGLPQVTSSVCDHFLFR